MTPAQLLHHRLHNQRLAATTFDEPADPVRWLGAVQAQDYRAALWAVGLRTRSATEKIVERAIVERAIVRTWPLRGTLHFVVAEDARWMRELTAPRMLAASAGPLERDYGLDDKTLGRSGAVVARALEGGRRLTRDALVEPAHARRVEGMDLLRPAIVVNGRVAGTWTRQLGSRSVELDLNPFTHLGTTARRAVTAAARRYAAFLELSADVS